MYCTVRIQISLSSLTKNFVIRSIFYKHFKDFDKQYIFYPFLI
jgi:hypothetical protein